MITLDNSPETWELLPDDWHDGADDITRRGRVLHLERSLLSQFNGKKEDI
jgi:hypothetical protein